MTSVTRLTKVKLRMKEENDKFRGNSLVSWGIFFVIASISSIFFNSMYGPIILGSLALVSFQYLQASMMASERVGILGKAYSNPFSLLYIESLMDGVKDIEESIHKWESFTDEERNKKNKTINLISVICFILSVSVISGVGSGIFWLLPA